MVYYLHMNTNKIEQWVKILAFALLTVSALMYASAQSKMATSGASFSVDGEATVSITPDIATFSAGVVTEGEDIAKVTDKNNTDANAIVDFLKEKGIEKKDIKTSNYSISPEYTWTCDENDTCTDEITGYSMTQSIDVKVRDFSLLGALLAGVVEKGANNVSGPWFELEEADSAEQDARTQAFDKAKEKAEEIAKAGDFKLGRIIGLSEWSDSGYDYYSQRSANLIYEETNDVTASDIQPGEEDVTINVSITYEIK